MASQKLPLMGHRDHKEEGEVLSEDDWTSSEVQDKRVRQEFPEEGQEVTRPRLAHRKLVGDDGERVGQPEAEP